jgi:hypothetical protein
LLAAALALVATATATAPVVAVLAAIALTQHLYLSTKPTRSLSARVAQVVLEPAQVAHPIWEHQGKTLFLVQLQPLVVVEAAQSTRVLHKAAGLAAAAAAVMPAAPALLGKATLAALVMARTFHIVVAVAVELAQSAQTGLALGMAG